MKHTIYNFSAGPAMLPKSVLKEVQNDLLNWNNTGTSIIEISHRSIEFNIIIQNLEKNLKNLLKIPSNYIILFFQGGARGQFSAIPINLFNKYDIIDYIDSGYWSYHAMIEAKKYCLPNHINIRKKNNNIQSLLHINQWPLSNNTNFLHYCPNETIEGITIFEEPNFKNKIIIGDFSSYLLSRKINIQKYDLIYASAQKNLGPAGMTIVIMKESLLDKINLTIPSIFDYKKFFFTQSMFNTPVTFSWYVASLVLRWMKNKGGIEYFENKNFEKSQLLYQKIDNSDFYINNIHPNNRSQMNVTFHLHDEKLNNIFLKESILNGLKFLKGHKVIGGFRASIYNAMPIQGVKKLINFMIDFEKKYG